MRTKRCQVQLKGLKQNKCKIGEKHKMCPKCVKKKFLNKIVKLLYKMLFKYTLKKCKIVFENVKIT